MDLHILGRPITLRLDAAQCLRCIFKNAGLPKAIDGMPKRGVWSRTHVGVAVHLIPALNGITN